MRLSGIIDRIFAILAIIENFVCYTGILGVTFLVFFNVLNRYLFRFEIMWVGDFSLYIFMIFVFACIVFTTREQGHTSVEVLLQRIGEKFPGTAKPFRLFLMILSFVTALIFTIPVLHFAQRSMRYPQWGTLVRWFNTSWIMQAMFIMMILILAHMIRLLIIEIYAGSSKKEPGAE
ncbi:MAG TPA: hypothetical protein DIV80_00625 [Synergistaceae bacterium]|nr:hypothetical protein [Synergistaceae bacterium]